MKVTVENCSDSRSFYEGDLVICDDPKDGGKIVRADFIRTDGTFVGALIFSKDKKSYNEFNKLWDSLKFKKFHGKIILEQ